MITALPPIVELSQLGELGDSILTSPGGESSSIQPLLDHEGLLFKRYTPERLQRPRSTADLDKLVALPAALTPANRGRISRQTSWPVARVTDGGTTVGAVIRSAPERMLFQVLSVVNKSRGTLPQFVDVDLLAKPNDYLASRGLKPQTTTERLAIGRKLASIGAIFEQNQVVYADWSYSNAFWSPEDQSTFLIDIDTCSFGPRKWVLTPNFDDPLTPLGVDVDNATDRYRIALLIGRCLTGLRELSELMTALLQPPSQEYAAAYAALRVNLLANDRDGRISIFELKKTLEAAEEGRIYTPPARLTGGPDITTSLPTVTGWKSRSSGLSTASGGTTMSVSAPAQRTPAASPPVFTPAAVKAPAVNGAVATTPIFRPMAQQPPAAPPTFPIPATTVETSAIRRLLSRFRKTRTN